MCKVSFIRKYCCFTLTSHLLFIYLYIYFFCRNGICPIFKTHSITCYPDKFADREIQALKVICINKKNGCEWSDCLRDLKVCFLLFTLFFSFNLFFIVIGFTRSLKPLKDWFYEVFENFETFRKNSLSNTNSEDKLYQRIIQKKSAFGSRTLTCLMIFFRNFILI